jgi:acyl-CoA synthetase (AMP-forming)/AMP-acid ligase II
MTALANERSDRALAQTLAAPFGSLSDLICLHAEQRRSSEAIADDRSRLTWQELQACVERIAVSLQRDGVCRGDLVAMLGLNSVRYAAAFLAILRLGAVPTPLPNSATAAAIGAMLEDCGTRWLLVDTAIQNRMPAGAFRTARQYNLDFEQVDGRNGAWLAGAGGMPDPVQVRPGDYFDVIYSSGTTGSPKGIVHDHAMRWLQIQRGIERNAYCNDSVVLLSTPLYSNTTLTTFLPALAAGARIVLMPKFDARQFLELAQRERATHYVLVPVQFRRILSDAGFDSYDLSSCRLKTSTSAPFPAELKAEVLRRWPGGLIDVYGMTEGGGTCVLSAHEQLHKLHTVGRPIAGHDVRLIDENLRELPRGAVGEVVGRSPAMMRCYLGKPDKTREAEWYDADGQRFIRHGDIGRFDEDGFLVLLDRAKDMIISGGFNIYPSDLEAALKSHPDVADAAVIGQPSEEWGETPVGFIVPRKSTCDTQEILAFANLRLGKTQRLAALHVIDELPRSTIGKILKRELRERLKDFGGSSAKLQ